MHIDKLLQREDFVFIFNKTIEVFFYKNKKYKINLNWNLKKKTKKNYFIVNPKLNIIFPRNMSTPKIYPYISQFYLHKNKLRSFVQNIYCSIIISKFFRKYFSINRISLSYWPDDFNNLIFLGGNHTISIVSLEENTTTQILKYKYDPSFIKASIEIRLKYPDLPVPKIIEFSLEDYWVKQEWVMGIPLNRISDKKKIEKSRLSANKSMIKLYEKTYKKENLYSWIIKLNDDIEENISKLSFIYDDKFRFQLKLIIKKIFNLYFSSESFIKYIYTSLTHGDYSGSNIIYTESKKFVNNFFLIDWDYSKRRYILYDFLVYNFKARMSGCLSDRIINFFKNNQNSNYYEDYLFKKYSDNLTNEEVIGLFLLEDLNVRIKENLIPNLIKCNPDLIHYMKQIDLITGKYEKF